jgi:hypothetical protein
VLLVRNVIYAGGLVFFSLIYVCESKWIAQLMYYTFSKQNYVSSIPDLTFSMDPNEEKHILCEKTEVLR